MKRLQVQTGRTQFKPQLGRAHTGQTRDNRTLMPTAVWRHSGPIWQAEAGFGHSKARHTLRNMDRGLFNNTTAQRTGLTVGFDDIFYLRPRVVTVADGTVAFISGGVEQLVRVGQAAYSSDFKLPPRLIPPPPNLPHVSGKTPMATCCKTVTPSPSSRT